MSIFPTKRATVQYANISREHAAHGLAHLLCSRGFDAVARLTAGPEVVNLEYPPLRGIQMKTWDEARQIVMDDMNTPRCKVVRLSEGAVIPTRGSAFSAGLDLCYDGISCKPVSWDKDAPAETGVVEIKAGFRYVLSTGLAVQAPAGHYGRVAPRSGLAMKGLDVSAGVVDADYTGELKVIVSLHRTAESLLINPGDRIAQLIFEKCLIAEPVEVETLEASERGAGGFGSTGR